MDDNQNQARREITMGRAFGIAFRSLKDNIEIAGLMSALFVVMWMILLGGMMADVFDLALQSQETDFNPPLPDGPGVGFFLMSIVFLYITQLPYVIWARATTLGRSDALDGGIPALLSRGMWCMWRLICMYGWMLLIMLGFNIVIYVLAALASTAGGGGFGDLAGGLGIISIVVAAILYIGLLYIVSALMGLYFVSVHAASQDARVDIRDAAKTLGPRAWKLGGAILVSQLAILIVMALAMGLVLVMVTTAGPGTSTILVIFGLLMFVTALLNFFYINLAAVYADLLTD